MNYLYLPTELYDKMREFSDNHIYFVKRLTSIFVALHKSTLFKIKYAPVTYHLDNKPYHYWDPEDEQMVYFDKHDLQMQLILPLKINAENRTQLFGYIFAGSNYNDNDSNDDNNDYMFMNYRFQYDRYNHCYSCILSFHMDYVSSHTKNIINGFTPFYISNADFNGKKNKKV